ncbi:MAG: excinuclease ABC subunit UvrC, partial [Treponema sp.]|nr:excinuclease ABC subunit UvrC [Treponema sp.]
EEGRIIYVGKAKSLRDRLASYFASGKDPKTATLVRRAASIETIVVTTEYEALLLENTLIKQHSPRYNINLKDGKSYPAIRITREDFPRVFRTRRIIEDGSQYFGPFPELKKVDAMLDLIERIFPLRKCRILRKRAQPCMYYHIDRCKAPCVAGKIGAEEYALDVERVRRLLSGEDEALLAELGERMAEAARETRFELAARLRDAIRAIRDLAGEESAVVDFDGEGRDYIAWASQGVLTTFTVFSMRGGKMTGRELFRARSAAEEGASLEHFIASYYDPARRPPAKIYAQPLSAAGETAGMEEPPPGGDSITQNMKNWFAENFGFEPEFPRADEKRHEAILAMARQNALEDLRLRLKERGAGPALEELARALGLSVLPRRIEAFDIAQLDGRHPVASLVSFKDGIPDKKNYRHFRLRRVVGIVDDFESMREAAQRRYSRLVREGAELPDLILIDGGIGQVGAAKGALEALGVACAVVGLAKRNEELWLPGAREPVVLSRSSEALRVLQHARDEAHRFATGLNQKLRSKGLAFSALESVGGIGKARAAAIMRACGDIAAVARSEPAELARLAGVPLSAAKAARAAARLAIDDRKAETRRLAGKGRARQGASGEALAAEAAPDYGAEG